MIMKKYNTIRSILLLAIILFSGCEDGFDTGLDLQPTGAVSESIFWQDEDDVTLAVNAIYNELDGTQMVIELDGITDIGFRSASNVPTFNDVRLGEIDPSNGTITAIWNRYYRGIRKANDVIANVGNLVDADQDELNRLEAEARFLRAYYYSQLASLWGDVPLILEPVDINDQRPANTKDEIVSFVIDELGDIINTNALPISYSEGNIGRATHGAALTLKARVALRNNMYQMVKEATQAVIDLGIYDLYPHYGQLFHSAGQNSAEVIFDRQYAVGGSTYNAFGYSAASIGGGSVVEPMHGLFTKYEYKGTVNPDDPFENIDPRWDFTAFYTGQPIGTSTFNSWPNSTTPDRVASTEFSTVYGYNLKKWIDYDTYASDPGLGSTNMILMRYADVLLMYAEAKVELNEIDNTVYDAINQIRQRPSVEMPPISSGKSQAELREIVRNERAIELAFEGLRIFDINRWKIGEVKAGLLQGMLYQNQSTGEWDTLNYGTVANFNERDYLWPIPQSEIDINDELQQNSDY